MRASVNRFVSRLPSATRILDDRGTASALASESFDPERAERAKQALLELTNRWGTQPFGQLVMELLDSFEIITKEAD